MAEDDAKPLAPGLYIVATPIGNLADITFRAIEVLKHCDLIACEDTRHSRKLLDHYGIATPTISYHEHNESERAAELAQRLRAGERVALISDAGTPAISDPGYRIVRAAVQAGVCVFPVPGPVAFAAALVASGLPTDQFAFRGFLPARRGERRTILESLIDSEATQIFYEAPHRLLETLEDVVRILSTNRPIVVARELTKVHEEFVRGGAAEVVEQIKQQTSTKGEIVLLIGKAARRSRGKTQELGSRLTALIADAVDEKTALKQLAKQAGLSRDELFRELQRHRKR